MPEQTTSPAIDPRVRLPRVRGRERHAPETVAYTRAVQLLSEEVNDKLDALGIPREVDAGVLSLVGRVDILLKTYEFDVETPAPKVPRDGTYQVRDGIQFRYSAADNEWLVYGETRTDDTGSGAVMVAKDGPCISVVDILGGHLRVVDQATWESWPLENEDA